MPCGSRLMLGLLPWRDVKLVWRSKKPAQCPALCEARNGRPSTSSEGNSVGVLDEFRHPGEETDQSEALRV
jgi:hypothetical protein